MSERRKPTIHQRWANLRFSVVGPLLGSPPARGDLSAELEQLSQKSWIHPVTEQPTRFGVSTIERWYYQAKNAGTDPVGVLKKKIRKDSGGQPSMGEQLRRVLVSQHSSHKSWSYQLHYDNLTALADANPDIGIPPSYVTVRRFMKASGLTKRRRLSSKETAGTRQAELRLETREVRSYEAAYVNGLWHLDFHHGSKKVVTSSGEWVKPLLLGVLDDRSRLACHVQWYLDETAESLIHGLSQALQKRLLPRMLMTDNGSAMVAAETTQGLCRLGIVHETTLPHSPYQNGKQESFWGQVEGRLLAMLENCRDLTLAILNEATQAWVELEYNRKIHSEIGETPLARYLRGPDVGRNSPSSDALRIAFSAEELRTQRRSDGTVSIESRRFEIPSRYRHLDRVTVRFASFDLGHVWLVDDRTGNVLSRIFPLDRTKNADGLRRSLEPVAELPSTLQPEPGIAPLLKKLMSDYAATGLPPAYVPKDGRKSSSNDNDSGNNNGTKNEDETR
jgi:transposase InsO family protein